LHAKNQRDRSKTRFLGLGQDNSRFGHGKAINFGEGLEYIKIWRLTKGIDLEPSTFGDQVEKQNLHLESLESKNRVEEAREGVPMEEEDPRMEPHLP
jgi:hypothetical protein